MYMIHGMPFNNALPICDGVGTKDIAEDITVKVIQNK